MLAGTPLGRKWPNLLVGNESSDDAAVYRLNDTQALVATTDFFTPIVDDAYDYGAIAAANALAELAREAVPEEVAAAYGGVTRSTNTWWKSKTYSAGSVNPTRQNILQYIAGTVKNGAEVPTFGITGFGTWTLLAQDFTSQERYNVTPGNAFGADNKTPYSANFMVSVQRELLPNMVATVSYVGTRGHNMLVIQQANPGDPALCLSVSQPSQVAPGSATCAGARGRSTWTS